MQVKIKNMPNLSLLALLKRRKTTLKKYVDELGLHTYTSLTSHCDSLGVSSPTQEQYKQAMPDVVSVPEEGVIVLPPTQKENTEESGNDEDEQPTNPNIPSLKKKMSSKRKKQERIEKDSDE